MSPAPKGNEYWKQRIKTNTKKYTPEELAEKAIEYFIVTEDKPFLKKDFKGKEIQEVYYELTKPFTEEGLCEYLNMHPETWRNYKSNKDSYKDYFEVATMISNAIRTKQLEGAMIGLYNPNMVSRYLGLSEKSKIVTEDENGVERPIEIKVTGLGK